MTLFLAASVLLLPFALEALVVNGFQRRRAERSLAFFVLTPVTSALVYASFAALLGHPWITCFAWASLYAGLTFVSNIKNRVLGEPLVAPDLETTRHLFIYPEFYVDYVGFGRFMSVIGLFVGTIVLGYFVDTSFVSHQTLLPTELAWALGLVGWILVLWLLARIANLVLVNGRNAARLGLTFDIQADVARFGLFPLMLLYGLLLNENTDKGALFNSRKPKTPAGKLPDLIVLQAESYFDVRRLYSCLPDHRDGWPLLAGLEGKGVAGGHLTVPCWGASTMQSEFSFLTGIPNALLGIDRINPYLRMANKPVPTLVSHLKALGYRTVCIHPAKKEFFRRNRVIPMLGFDEFIGLEAFEDAERLGPYVSDAALGDSIEALIAEHHAMSDAPLFLFAITIESHGPWEAGRLSPWLDENDLIAREPTGNAAFALYRHHMDNALKLFDRLGPSAHPTRPRAMVMYGDHQPALNDLFVRYGFSDTRVNYLLWKDGGATGPEEARIETLADLFLNTAGL